MRLAFARDGMTHPAKDINAQIQLFRLQVVSDVLRVVENGLLVVIDVLLGHSNTCSVHADSI